MPAFSDDIIDSLVEGRSLQTPSAEGFSGHDDSQYGLSQSLEQALFGNVNGGMADSVGLPPSPTQPVSDGMPPPLGAEIDKLVTMGQPQQEAVLGPQTTVDTSTMTQEQLRTYELKRMGVSVGDKRSGVLGYLWSSAQNIGAGFLKGTVGLLRDTGLWDSDLAAEFEKELGKPIVEHQIQQRVNIERAMEKHGVIGRAGVIAAQTAADVALFLGFMYGMPGMKFKPTGAAKAITGAKALTSGNLAAAAKLAAFRFVGSPVEGADETERMKQRALAAGLSFAYRATPALSGLASTPLKTRLFDMAFNSGISITSKQYNEAWERGKQEAAAAGDPDGWLAYSLTNLLPIFGTDLYFSAITKSLGEELVRAGAAEGVGNIATARGFADAKNVVYKFFENRVQEGKPVPKGFESMPFEKLYNEYKRYHSTIIGEEARVAAEQAKATQEAEAAERADVLESEPGLFLRRSMAGGTAGEERAAPSAEEAQRIAEQVAGRVETPPETAPADTGVWVPRIDDLFADLRQGEAEQPRAAEDVGTRAETPIESPIRPDLEKTGVDTSLPREAATEPSRAIPEPSVEQPVAAREEVPSPTPTPSLRSEEAARSEAAPVTISGKEYRVGDKLVDEAGNEYEVTRFSTTKTGKTQGYATPVGGGAEERLFGGKNLFPQARVSELQDKVADLINANDPLLPNPTNPIRTIGPIMRKIGADPSEKKLVKRMLIDAGFSVPERGLNVRYRATVAEPRMEDAARVENAPVRARADVVASRKSLAETALKMHEQLRIAADKDAAPSVKDKASDEAVRLSRLLMNDTDHGPKLANMTEAQVREYLDTLSAETSPTAARPTEQPAAPIERSANVEALPTKLSTDAKLPEERQRQVGFLTIPNTVRVQNTNGKFVKLDANEPYRVEDAGEGKLRLIDGKQVTVFEGDLPANVREAITTQPNIAAGGLTPQQRDLRAKRAEAEEAAQRSAVEEAQKYYDTIKTGVQSTKKTAEQGAFRKSMKRIFRLTETSQTQIAAAAGRETGDKFLADMTVASDRESEVINAHAKLKEDSINRSLAYAVKPYNKEKFKDDAGNDHANWTTGNRIGEAVRVIAAGLDRRDMREAVAANDHARINSIIAEMVKDAPDEQTRKDFTASIKRNLATLAGVREQVYGNQEGRAEGVRHAVQGRR